MKKCIICLVLISGLLCGCNKKEEIIIDNLNTDKSSVVLKSESGENLPKEENTNAYDENSGEANVVSDNSGEIIGDELATNVNSGENSSNPATNETIVTEVIPASSSNLSNKTNAWGFVRKKDNVQPEFASQYTKVLDDYQGIYVGNSEEQNIYLTFDEGYENGYTDDILDTLKEKEVTAVFFVTMPYVKQNADLVQRMIDEGHIVGNHTVNHPSMPDVTDDEKLKKEIMDLHDYVKENFNYEMTFLRPPKGEYSERTVKIALDLGYRTVLWSSAYDDWDVNKQGRLDYARGMILNNLHNGCVMLLHAVSKDNTELLGEIIDEVRNRGYEFYSLEEFEY